MLSELTEGLYALVGVDISVEVSGSENWSDGVELGSGACVSVLCDSRVVGTGTKITPFRMLAPPAPPSEGLSS